MAQVDIALTQIHDGNIVPELPLKQMVFSLGQFYVGSLFTILPSALINQCTVAVELPISMTSILEELPFIVVAILPDVHSIASFSI